VNMRNGSGSGRQRCAHRYRCDEQTHQKRARWNELFAFFEQRKTGTRTSRGKQCATIRAFRAHSSNEATIGPSRSGSLRAAAVRHCRGGIRAWVEIGRRVGALTDRGARREVLCCAAMMPRARQGRRGGERAARGQAVLQVRKFAGSR
jgi:hypothetical protein